MALSDFKPLKEKITVNDTCSVEVRGLSLSDISNLVALHAQDLDGVYELYHDVSLGKEFNGIILGELIFKLISSAPGLVSSIIAMASDEPEAVDAAALLPIMSQYEIIQSVFKLTFSDLATLKKVVADAMAKVGEVQAVAKKSKKKA